MATPRFTAQISLFTLRTIASGAPAVFTSRPWLLRDGAIDAGTKISGSTGDVMPWFFTSATTPTISKTSGDAAAFATRQRQRETTADRIGFALQVHARPAAR